MKKHGVKIRRIIDTCIEVEAVSAKDALTQVREYGDIQAASDYKVTREYVETSISYLGLIKE